MKYQLLFIYNDGHKIYSWDDLTKDMAEHLKELYSKAMSDPRIELKEIQIIEDTDH